ncbi:MoaF-related domain-containing protein [Mesorhizobium sp. 10J20-29]
MNALNAVPTLVGQSFDCVFDAFTPRLTFHPDDRIRVEATISGTRIDQIVQVEVAMVRPNVFVVSWVEDNGNFIVQLQDHENGIVHNHARLADGQVFRAAGRLQAAASG